MSCPINNVAFVAIKMGRRQGARRAHILTYLTDEQRSRRPIFIATLRAVASWLFFRVARSTRNETDGRFARALKNSQLTDGESPHLWDRTQAGSSTTSHISPIPFTFHVFPHPLPASTFIGPVS